jgi:hypothetical protein
MVKPSAGGSEQIFVLKVGDAVQLLLPSFGRPNAKTVRTPEPQGAGTGTLEAIHAAGTLASAELSPTTGASLAPPSQFAPSRLLIFTSKGPPEAGFFHEHSPL